MKGDETDKIRDRLDDGENVVMWVRQSRIKPGSVGGINPNTIFVTEKRVIIRSPVTFGLGEHIEEYFYRQITNVRLEKGVMSASLVFYIPGMTRDKQVWTAGSCGGKATAARSTPYQRMTQRRYTITSGKRSARPRRRLQNGRRPRNQKAPTTCLR